MVLYSPNIIFSSVDRARTSPYHLAPPLTIAWWILAHHHTPSLASCDAATRARICRVAATASSAHNSGGIAYSSSKSK
jgi:hypothetical protein